MYIRKRCSKTSLPLALVDCGNDLVDCGNDLALSVFSFSRQVQFLWFWKRCDIGLLSKCHSLAIYNIKLN